MPKRPLCERYAIHNFAYAAQAGLSDAASGWAGWALAHPEFWSSVNPIPTRGQIMPTTILLAHPNLKT